jgi:proteasome accessory factor C
MSGATDRLPRLLALVPYLTAHPGSRLADVAATFKITEQQLKKDLDLVWMCGLPGHLPGDLIDVDYVGDRVTVSNAETIDRPLRLSADEALALVVALRTLADLPGADTGDAVRRALAKLERAAGDAADAASRVSVDVEAEPTVVATVREALARGRRVHLTYYVPGRDESTERDVDPMRVHLVEGRFYLEGWCHRVEAMRLFRADRILAVRLLDVPAEPPPEATPRDMSEGLYRPAPSDPEVTLRLRPAARWVAEYYPCESVVEDADGLVVRLRVSDQGWLRRLALRLGADAEIVEPAELSALVREEAALALSAYR